MSKIVVSNRRFYLPYKADYYVTQWDGGFEDHQHTAVSGTSLSTVTRGENLPNWMRLIRLGLNATTSLSGTIARVQPLRVGSMSAHWSYAPDIESVPPKWYTRVGASGGLFSPDPTLPTTNPLTISSSSAESLALARFNEKAASVNRQFQGGVFFAELVKTVHGIRHPAEALFKGIERYHSAAKKLRKKTIQKYLRQKIDGDNVGPLDLRSLGRKQRKLLNREFTKSVAGLWLENSFHWVPLMYDIQGAVSALKASYQRAPSTFIKVSARDVQSVGMSYAQYGISFLNVDISTKLTSYASVRMYGRVGINKRTQGIPDSKALGYDLRSFVPTLWELVPYSWAVDYFTNIGSMIYGVSQGGQDVIWCAIGIKRCAEARHVGSANCPPPKPPAGHHTTEFRVNGITSEVLAEKAIVSRSTYTGGYIPTFRWNMPGVSLKWLNLGAAFLQNSVKGL